MLTHVLFSDIATQFIEDKKLQNNSPQTVSLYTRELRYFSSWLNNNNLLFIENINTISLKKWFTDLGTHRNPGGVHVNYRIVKTLFNYFDFNYEPEQWKNPIKKVILKPNRTPPLDEIPLEHVKLLINVTQGKNEIRDRCILKFLVDTGVRGSELIGLNVEDINLENGAVRINHGKGNKYRLVWLGKSGLKALKEYLNTRKGYLHSEPLFLNDEKMRLQFLGLRMLVIRLCQRAAIKNYGIHSFRRLFALTLYRKTHDVFFVSKLLGHSSVEITKRYLHLNNEDLRDIHNQNSPADDLD
jgi:integrase/recombinase XerD